MKKQQPIIIIDNSFIIHYNKRSMEGLSADERKTGIIYAYIKFILSLSNKFKTNKFVFAVDSRKSKRREIYPQYKKKRYLDQTEEDKELNRLAFAQSDELMNEILPNLGFKNIIHLEGYEADDIIGKAINPNDEFIIISLDNDLYQLLDKNVSMYNITTKKLITRSSFMDKYGIEPELWYDVKCLVGCKGDNIGGIEGVADKTAIKYLLGTLPTHIIKHKLISDWNSLKSDIKTSIPNIVAELVKVPFAGTPDVVVDFNEQFYLDSFMKFCDNYRMKSFIVGSEFDIFKNNFCGGE